MENITHTLLGLAMANSGPARRFGRGTTLTLAVASNLPDLDGMCMAMGQEGIFFRRGLTHSLLGIVVLSAAAAWLLRLKYREQSWRTLFGLCVLGAAGHLLLDLINSFGVVLLSPFSDRRFELAWVFIVDLALTGILIAPWTLASSWMQMERLSRAALAGALLYLAICGAGHSRTEDLVRERSPDADWVYAFPEAGGSHRFRGVSRTGDEYEMCVVFPWTGAVEPADPVKTDEADPQVARLKTTDLGRRVQWFFKAPVWRRLDSGEYEAFDLRFASSVFRRSPLPFTFRFRP
jgi:membrane-bound metal-dependent hydrolase YbcI (DUF457 family)